MVDIASISSALSSLKIATDITRLLRESGLTLEKAEIKLKLAELIEALAETKIQLSEIKNLVFERDQQIKELEDALKIKRELKWEIPFYYLDEVDSKDGPYCQQCYDKDGKLIRLQEPRTGSGALECKTCGKHFYEKKYEDHIKSIDYSDTFR